MALLNEEMDSDLLRLWGLIAELAEQTNANRAMTTALQQQAAQAKVSFYRFVSSYRSWWLIRRLGVWYCRDRSSTLALVSCFVGSILTYLKV